MGSLKKIFMFLYSIALLPVVLLTILRVVMGADVPLFAYIIAVVVAAVSPFFVLGRLMRNKNEVESVFLDKLQEWDFSEDEDEDDDGSVLSMLYKDIQQYFKKLFTSMQKMTTVSDNLLNSIDHVADNAASISQISDGIAQGAIAQAREVEVCAGLSDDIGAKTREMSDMSDGLIKETAHLSDISEQGNKNILSLKEDNATLSQTINGIVDQVNNLVDMASNITKITEIMYGISDQTSLLALNASIEAARAGEVGRSFAVVAEEIRKLSNDSRESSANINDMITSITTSLTEIKRTLDQSEAIFNNQYDSVEQAAVSFNNVNLFIKDFIDKQNVFGATFDTFQDNQETLISSIETIASVSQESAATTEELASLVMSQHNSMEALKDLTGDLKGHADTMKDYSKNIKVDNEAIKRNRLALITDSTNEFWDPMKNTAKQTAKIYNVDVDIFEAGDRSHCVENQIKFLKQVKEEGYAGIAISPVNDGRIKEALNDLMNNQVKVLFINSQLPGCKGLGLFETNGIEAGKSAAKVVSKLLRSKGEVIYGRWSDVHIDSIEQRGQGFEQGLKSSRDIKLHIASIPANPTPQEAENIISNLLKQHPNTELFYATNIDWAMHYVAYKKKFNAKFKIVTIDFVKSIQQEVRQGVISSCISQRPFVWGEMAVKALVDATNSKAVKNYVDTGTFEMNSQNIDVFINRF